MLRERPQPQNIRIGHIFPVRQILSSLRGCPFSKFHFCVTQIFDKNFVIAQNCSSEVIIDSGGQYLRWSVQWLFVGVHSDFLGLRTMKNEGKNYAVKKKLLGNLLILNSFSEDRNKSFLVVSDTGNLIESSEIEYLH